MRAFSVAAGAMLLLAGTSLATAQTMPPVQGGNAATGPAATGPTGGPMNINGPALTPAQRTQAVTVLRSANIQPVTGVTLSVGQPVPATVTQLSACPATFTGVPDCRVVMVGNTYYIVEGGSRRVVTSIAP